jgi:murein L,D-transpeptidase YafK
MQRYFWSALILMAAGLALASADTGQRIVEVESGGARAVEQTQYPVADQVIVRKSERRMLLMRRGEVLRSYHVALGLMPEGTKERAGDFRTPEGAYRLTRRNARSDFFLSIQVSYPNEADLRRARHNGWKPGGSIMIHGLPNILRHPPDYYAGQDWTDGCIALSDSDMVEFWLMTQDNAPIDIRP